MFQQTPVLFQLASRVGLFETVDKVSVKSHLNSDANNIGNLCLSLCLWSLVLCFINLTLKLRLLEHIFRKSFQLVPVSPTIRLALDLSPGHIYTTHIFEKCSGSQWMSE